MVLAEDAAFGLEQDVLQVFGCEMMAGDADGETTHEFGFKAIFDKISCLDPGQGFVIQGVVMVAGGSETNLCILESLEDPVAELIIQGKLKESEILAVYLKDEKLYFKARGSKSEGTPVSYGLV